MIVVKFGFLKYISQFKIGSLSFFSGGQWPKIDFNILHSGCHTIILASFPILNPLPRRGLLKLDYSKTFDLFAVKATVAQ